MLRRLSTFGLGVVKKGGEKVAKRVERVSSLARHPRTEIVTIVEKVMQAGESELDRLELILRNSLTKNRLEGTLSQPLPATHVDVPKPLPAVGTVVEFSDIKSGKKRLGQVKSVNIDPEHRFFLVRLIGDVRMESKYYLCCEQEGDYVGEDEI